MKYLFLLGTLLFSSMAMAAGGFMWLGNISHSLHLPQHVVTFFLVSLILLVFGLIYRMKTTNIEAAIIPDSGISFRNIFEAIGEFIYKLTRTTIGPEMTKRYYPLLMFMFSMIFISNLIGLVPGFYPPTDNFNTTLALGSFVFIYYNYHGVRVQGVVGHLKHLMGPIWYIAPLMFIIEIISHGVRPISLGLRLKGNMQGDHMVLTIFSDLIPYIIPIPFYVLGIFVCFMQAFVFTILTMVYINLSCVTHDHEDH